MKMILSTDVPKLQGIIWKFACRRETFSLSFAIAFAIWHNIFFGVGVKIINSSYIIKKNGLNQLVG
jgi:hypothetical protein